MAFTGDNRDRRAAAQGMLWSPLHPDPDGAALSVDDRKIVIGVYPIRVTVVTSGVSVGTRGRHEDVTSLTPSLLGQYVPDIDRTLNE
jgi:hypothetical protein